MSEIKPMGLGHARDWTSARPWRGLPKPRQTARHWSHYDPNTTREREIRCFVEQDIGRIVRIIG